MRGRSREVAGAVAAQGPSEAGRSHADGSLPLSQLQQSLGPPLLVAGLVHGLPSKLPPSQSWVLVSSEAMVHAKLTAGQQMMVAITDQHSPSQAASPSPNRSSPAPRTPTTPSSFAPANVPSLEGGSASVRSLWELNAASGVITWQQQVMSRQQAQQQGQSQQPQQDGQQGPTSSSSSSLSSPPWASPACQGGQRLGHFVLPASVWPLQKLPRGSVALSPTLLEICGGGRLAAGTVLALLAAPAAPQPCRHLALRLLPQSANHPTSTATSTTATTATTTPGAASTPGSSSVAGSAILTPTTTPAKSPAPHAASGTPGPQPSPASASASAQVSTAAAGGVPTWLTQLLQPSPAQQGSGRQQQQQQQGKLLEQLMLKHLDGRTLLPGNPVLLPLLGHTLTFSCEAATTQTASAATPTTSTSSSIASTSNPTTSTSIPSTSASSTSTSTSITASEAARPAASPSTSAYLSSDIQAPAVIRFQTQVRLLLPGEAADADGEPHGAATTASGAGGGLGQRRAEVIARARSAAAEVVAPSAAEAAAAAAERAVLAGLGATSPGFSSLGGVTEVASNLRQLVALPLRAPQLFEQFKIKPPRGVLLWGPPGSGKTVLARAAAADAGATLMVINGPDVVSEFYGESEAGLKGIFAAARALSPCVIFIDEVDAIAPSRGGDGGGGGGGGGGMSAALGSGGGGGGMSGRMLTVLLTLMDGFANGSDGVVVIAATNRPNALDSALRRPGRFERELEIGVPSPQARLEILKSRLQSVHHRLSDQDISSLANSAHGYVGADLALLVDEAALAALRRVVASGSSQQAELAVLPDDFAAAETRVRPSGMREVAVEVPRVRWEDIGGLRSVKERLQEVVEWPSRHPDALQRLGAVPPRGVLLYGPPGCSKTLLAKAVATESRLNFLSIKGGELFSKYVGESEKAIATLFARARAAAPAIVFFDEIDALAAARSEDGETGTGDRVLSQLLMELDGLQARANVVVLAATNRPDCVDPALLRPGRFDRLVHVPPPDSQGREEVFRVHLRRTPLLSCVDLAALATRTPGYTGADISALCREAALSALEEDLGAQQVCGHHFDRALELVGPSAAASPQMEEVYRKFSCTGFVA